MPKVPKSAFYAVHIGEQPGIYRSWADCEQQIKGYPKARFKKFSTEVEADAFVKFGTASRTITAAGAGNTVYSKYRMLPRGVGKTYMSKKLGKRKADDVIDEREWEIVYTDGACRRNGEAGAVAGIGVWWGQSDPRNLSERCPGDQTNNRAELIAIIRLLETASQRPNRLLIKTDSSYSISCVREWIHSWRKRGWRNVNDREVKNKAVILYLSYLLDQRSQRGQVVRLQHVRGHAGVSGNEGADKLAGAGALMPAIPERDWDFPKTEGSNEPGKDALEECQASSRFLTALRPVSSPSGKGAKGVNALVEDSDLLSPEDLQRMLMDGEFD